MTKRRKVFERQSNGDYVEKWETIDEPYNPPSNLEVSLNIIAFIAIVAMLVIGYITWKITLDFKFSVIVGVVSVIVTPFIIAFILHIAQGMEVFRIVYQREGCKGLILFILGGIILVTLCNLVLVRFTGIDVFAPFQFLFN